MSVTTLAVGNAPAAHGSTVRYRGRYLRRAVTVCLLVVVALGWFELAPRAWGGKATYVVIQGTSMLPHFTPNGLVITRAEPSYHVGEVVAYHNESLHVVVMHRIIAHDGDQYIFQGDNNKYPDPYHATANDLVGKEWLYWPGGGKYFQFLRTPFLFGLIMAFVGVIAFARPPARIRRRRRHHAQS